MPNRLAGESSPYLLQHQENPVDWYPWGEEALSRARAENKPILLSVGYSACHWCHVMAHESFEDPTVAQVMNERFINIKVDREERPDLDQIYQNVAQAITRGGGWPLTVFLTSELKPFFGGTYFPPEDRWGRPGFKRVLIALSDAFRDDPASVAENAEKLTGFIQSLEAVPNLSGIAPTREKLIELAEQLLAIVDWERGGLQGAPKFPNPMIFSFLWRAGSLMGIDQAKEAALLALTRMAEGGIYDQIGGGFHRYSVDDSWSVPHFEKMLYDNALLLKLYSEVLLSDDAAVSEERKALFTRVLRETVGYILREMISAEGCFYAAQDADSEGEEGKFFVWDRADLAQVLEGPGLELATLAFGVTAEGNFEHGKTVLYAALSLSEAADRAGVQRESASALLESAKRKLLEARAKRIAPGTDDKILASWNGLMISGLLWSAQALAARGEGELASRAGDAARRAFRFLRKNLALPGGKLASTFQRGAPRFNGYLDDYAFMAKAAMDLSRFTSSEAEIDEFLGAAREWISTVLARFSDSSGHGYFFTSDDHERLLQRPKNLFDQAIPSGTSVVLSCLCAFGEIEPEGRGAEFEREFLRQIAPLFEAGARNPYGCGELLSAALLAVAGPVVLSGKEAWRAIAREEVFRKAAEENLEGILLCHRRACSAPIAHWEQARQEARSKLRT